MRYHKNSIIDPDCTKVVNLVKLPWAVYKRSC